MFTRRRIRPDAVRRTPVSSSVKYSASARGSRRDAPTPFQRIIVSPLALSYSSSSPAPVKSPDFFLAFSFSARTRSSCEALSFVSIIATKSTPRDPSRAGEEAIVADADPRAGTGYVTESYVVEERGPSNCPPRISRCACRGRKGTLLFAQGGRPKSTLAEVATRQISQLPAPTMTRMRFHPDRGVLVGSRPRTPNPTIHRATATPAGLGRHEPARPHRGRLARRAPGCHRLPHPLDEGRRASGRWSLC